MSAHLWVAVLFCLMSLSWAAALEALFRVAESGLWWLVVAGSAIFTAACCVSLFRLWTALID